MIPAKKPRISAEEKLLSHPLYDHRDERFHRPQDCPDSLCVLDVKEVGICTRCPRQLENTVYLNPHPPTEEKHKGWGGRRKGAGAPIGSFNHLKTGKRSALIRRAVAVLAEHKELRPFLLLIARAAVEGEIPQTTRRLILQALGDKPTVMLGTTVALKRLRCQED